MILKLIGMIVLGILSGILSYYNKNFYVRVFDDILGREQEENIAVKVGRGFFYGFLFPIYFALLATGLICLIVLLIVAGIIAAIVFVLVWITEKILPNESAGNLLISVFEKIGLSAPPISREPEAAPINPPTPASPPTTPEGSGTQGQEASDNDAPKA